MDVALCRQLKQFGTVGYLSTTIHRSYFSDPANFYEPDALNCGLLDMQAKRGQQRGSRLPGLARLTDFDLGTAQRGRNRNSALETLLRHVALSARSSEVQPFYSIREVASRFHFSPTTVSRIFGRLKAEGLLTQLWGSNTSLEPTGVNRRLRVRGFVAQLVTIAAISTNRQCRELVNVISDELWKLRFASRLWFYDQSESDPALLFQAIVSATPDALVCIMPDGWTKSLMHRFRTYGLAVIAISDRSLAHEQVRALNHLATHPPLMSRREG